MRTRRVVTLSTLIVLFSIVFALYLGSLYQQLGHAFSDQEQFVPTRIYSDVTRVAPSQPRIHIEERLHSLGYTPQATGQDLSFNLHTPDYPSYLVPDGHSLPDTSDPSAVLPVVLHFDSEEKTALLQSIELGHVEVPDLYLEPELVATLSRGQKKVMTLTQFDEIPAQIWKAIIAVEDQHFLEHKGFDPRGLLRALWIDLRTHSFAQGGSTITQQLVKNLMARHTKNPFRKVNEIFLSVMLEMRVDKERILERYLNEVYLGQAGNFEIHGVAEGAEHFFGKKLEDLNLAEIALMAGVIRGPYFYSPYRHQERALERERLVLRKMVETGQIAEEEAEAALKLPIHLVPQQSAANKAPYFTDFVKAELIRQLKDKMSEDEITQAGFRVYTTLDPEMNTAAQLAIAHGIKDLESRLKLKAPDRLEGALASVDHTTGYIRALIGGRNYGESNFNRILNMRRQVGSTFKPFVYLAALLKGEDANGVPYGPGHPAEDGPWTLKFDHGKQEWTPRNYDKDYFGWVNYRTALAHSINTVAAKLGTEIGVASIINTARGLGVESDLPAVPSLALGVAELSPVELLRAYAILANHGVQDELTVIRAITHDDETSYARFIYHPKQVLDPGAADLMTDMLRSVFTEGTAHQAADMGFEYAAAGKTGTTSNYRDAWFAGYTPQITTVVWVGMDQVPTSAPSAIASKKPEPRPRAMLTGASSALPIWVDYMKKILSAEPPATFPISPALIDVQIDRHSGKTASGGCPIAQTYTEKYQKGHEPRTSACDRAWPQVVRATEAP